MKPKVGSNKRKPDFKQKANFAKKKTKIKVFKYHLRKLFLCVFSAKLINGQSIKRGIPVSSTSKENEIHLTNDNCLFTYFIIFIFIFYF